jgi:hypothetical protein
VSEVLFFAPAQRFSALPELALRETATTGTHVSWLCLQVPTRSQSSALRLKGKELVVVVVVVHTQPSACFSIGWRKPVSGDF